MRIWRHAGIVSLLVCMPVHVGAQGLQGSSGSRVYTVARERTIPLGQHYSSQNCAFTGVPQVIVLQNPGLGTISQAVVQTTVETTPLDASGKPRPVSHTECAGKPMTVVEVRYTAGSTRGTDSFSYQLTYPGGNTGRIDARVTVK
ncbi:hypothetical protein [Microvirga arsenatis]|uniref:Uncharacterized protein n=1 Tax=Microvirga arsenatis TaxID=2692265 RepID=A0ABW9YS49_9HYPH|nr:hypothetical protein [Microvirga arsenatis]NBJ09790.1 hypothetical protein [Microvirga arsenatis]NBJ22859.1 hypothetical protein [Microvirga arsenatis]